MMLMEKIKEDITQALRSGDSLKKEILRVVVGEVQRKSDVKGDEDVQKVIRKIIEANNETISKGGSDTLLKENNILNEYLPKMWTVEEIKAFLANNEQVLSAKSEGAAMGVAMKALKGVGASVDGKDVKTVVTIMKAANEKV